MQNHVNLYDVAFNYQLSPRWSIIGDIPGLTATRHQQGNVNVYRDGGIGDERAADGSAGIEAPFEKEVGSAVQLFG